MLYLVNYQFRPVRVGVQKRVAETIQSPPTQSWWHYMDNTWIVQTYETANQLYDRIHECFVQPDSVLVVQLNRSTQVQGWLPKEAWNWLSERKAIEP